MLIPIRHLINGTSVAQIDRQTITYYHIELPQHDVLLADGMPAETKAALEEHAGVRITCLQGAEIAKAAGGVHCLTRPLYC